MRVFVSHAGEDAKLAETLALRLRDAGFDVFMSGIQIRGGDDYQHKIEAFLRRADALVFLASPESLSKDSYSRAELEMFRRKHSSPTGRVLPILVRDATTESLPPYLQAVSVGGEAGDPAVIGLLNARALLARLVRRRRWRIGLAGAILALVGVGVRAIFDPRTPGPVPSTDVRPPDYDSKASRVPKVVKQSLRFEAVDEQKEVFVVPSDREFVLKGYDGSGDVSVALLTRSPPAAPVLRLQLDTSAHTGYMEGKGEVFGPGVVLVVQTLTGRGQYDIELSGYLRNAREDSR